MRSKRTRVGKKLFNISWSTSPRRRNLPSQTSTSTRWERTPDDQSEACPAIHQVPSHPSWTHGRPHGQTWCSGWKRTCTDLAGCCLQHRPEVSGKSNWISMVFCWYSSLGSWLHSNSSWHHGSSSGKQIELHQSMYLQHGLNDKERGKSIYFY